MLHKTANPSSPSVTNYMIVKKKLSESKLNVLLYGKVGLSRLVISAGMPRSGSTLLFNIIRLIAISDENLDVSSGWITDVARLSKGNFYILKTHELNDFMLWRSSQCFYSYRDIRDALVSYYRKFHKQPSIELVRQWIKQFESAKKKATLMVRYEDLVNNQEKTIIDISKKMSIDLSQKSSIEKLLHEIDVGNISENVSRTRYSPTTLLHKNHRTGTQPDEWQTVLSEELIESIYREFNWWFIENGYPKI